MQQGIPIIITRNTHHHQTRTRRISSSAAAKRFPKDFFKDQNTLHPIKSNKINQKYYEPFLLDTFSQKNFAMAIESQNSKESRQESGNDTPKFKQRSSTIQHKNMKTQSNKRKKHKRNNEDSCDSPLINKYNTISPQVEKNNINIQRKQLQKHEKNLPFNSIPFITNFNITLGQKMNIANFINQKSILGKKMKQVHQKQNNIEIMSSLSARRQKNNLKNQGFRIRKKLMN